VTSYYFPIFVVTEKVSNEVKDVNVNRQKERLQMSEVLKNSITGKLRFEER